MAQIAVLRNLRAGNYDLAVAALHRLWFATGSRREDH